MDNRSSLDEDPRSISQINAVPILPTTLKGLKLIGAHYQKNGMRPRWRTTQFQYLAVIARLLQVGPKYVLSDNTDILIHEANKRPVGSQLLIKHQYYRFIFEITPYASDSLAILNIQSVTPAEVGAHIAEIVQEELKSQMHESLLKSVAENQNVVEVILDVKKQVLAKIAGRTQFTVEELKAEIECSSEFLTEILLQLSFEGKIGDMGNYYIVVEKEQ